MKSSIVDILKKDPINRSAQYWQALTINHLSWIFAGTNVEIRPEETFKKDQLKQPLMCTDDLRVDVGIYGLSCDEVGRILSIKGLSHSGSSLAQKLRYVLVDEIPACPLPAMLLLIGEWRNTGNCISVAKRAKDAAQLLEVFDGFDEFFMWALNMRIQPQQERKVNGLEYQYIRKGLNGNTLQPSLWGSHPRQVEL